MPLKQQPLLLAAVSKHIQFLFEFHTEAHLSSYIINILLKTFILFTAQASRAQTSHSQGTVTEVFCDSGVTRKTGHPQ